MKKLYLLGGLVMVVVLTAGSCSGSKVSVDQSVNTNVPANNDTTNNISTSAKVVTVEYTDAGFAPATVNVKVGDTVKFVNKSSSPFWPASDPHPIHTGLGGFDAKAQVAVGESFSFKFSKTGNFGFHNHLKPTAKGKVVVE